MKRSTFNDVLEVIDALPEEQKETLVEIVKHRLIEERREALARSIKEAREEYARGEVKRGSVDDLMEEVAK